MKNKQYEILRQGKSTWDAWRKANPDTIIDLSGTDLSGADLRSTNLSGVNLSEAKLSKANLTRAMLINSNLHAVKLDGAKLNSAMLNDAYMEHADLTGADLCNADLTGVDLIEARLSRSDLRNASLIGANLTRASLWEADMTEAKLRNANLRDANLREADLRRADLTRAILVEANLCEADLREVDLSQAVIISCLMQGTNLKHARCNTTTFVDVNLSVVKGLETVCCSGPSFLDVMTLYTSQGKIPETFLRMGGVPENLMVNLPSLTGRGINFYSCFIRYSHADKDFACRLQDQLQRRGIRCWLDGKQAHPGDYFYEEIERSWRYYDKVLLCCSKTALMEKWWVDYELNRAVNKEDVLIAAGYMKGFSLILADLDGYLFSNEDTNSKAEQLRSRIVADFKGWEQDNAIFERGVKHLVHALRTDSK